MVRVSRSTSNTDLVVMTAISKCFLLYAYVYQVAIAKSTMLFSRQSGELPGSLFARPSGV